MRVERRRSCSPQLVAGGSGDPPMVPKTTPIDRARCGSHSRGLVATRTHTPAAVIGLTVLALSVAAGAAPPPLAEPAFVYKPAKGFIDDPFAVDGEQGR